LLIKGRAVVWHAPVFCLACIMFPLVMVPARLMVSVSLKTLMFAFWNARGLGDDSKCEVVRDNLLAAKRTVVCLQETKLASLDRAKSRSFLPPHLTDFRAVDAVGTRGGLAPLGTTALCRSLPPFPKLSASPPRSPLPPPTPRSPSPASMRLQIIASPHSLSVKFSR
jgi:hypothetical protein